MQTTFWSTLAAAVALGAAAGPSPVVAADTRTVVEELIAAQNPCQELRTKQLGITIGIETLKEVRLRTATIRLEGDQVSLEFNGRLACETSPGAPLEGDAAASVEASAALSLADCSIAALEVHLSDFGGSFGPLLAALAPTVESELRKAAAPKIREACLDFRQTSR